jgi:ribonuclease P protein component
MNPAPATAAGGAGDSPRPRERLPAAQRLRRTADFEEARQRGRRIEAGAFTLNWYLRAEGPRRLGVVASRRTGPAVRRNRAKRVLRELFRRHPDALPPSCDVVVIVRASFFQHSFATLRARYLHAAGQVGRTSRPVV